MSQHIPPYFGQTQIEGEEEHAKEKAGSSEQPQTPHTLENAPMGAEQAGLYQATQVGGGYSLPEQAQRGHQGPPTGIPETPPFHSGAGNVVMETRVAGPLGEAPRQSEPSLGSTVLGSSGALRTIENDPSAESSLVPSALRTTILPRIQSDQQGKPVLVQEITERYEKMRRLGAGAVGEVSLVKDNDIRRLVAMKRIKGDKKEAAYLMRFIEEVQTVGQLEHPNIVPIHDVGLDQDGQYYFTMKYVQGETLERVIQKLRKGVPGYRERYSFERRTQIFVEILHAIRFAHEQGYIHRDLKPANIMVGEYGEVQVMDWGIAKRIHKGRRAPLNLAGNEGALRTFETLHIPTDGLHWQERVFQTQHGDIIGTPAYMSPEQILAAELDERSDVYALVALFYEFVNLQHYMAGKASLPELLHGILNEKPLDSEKITQPHQGPVPREICFFLRKGLEKQPEDRYQSAEEMIQLLQGNLEGKICVHCPSTFLKRVSHGFGHYLDNHRVLGVVWFGLVLLVFGFGVAQLGIWLATVIGG